MASKLSLLITINAFALMPRDEKVLGRLEERRGEDAIVLTRPPQ